MLLDTAFRKFRLFSDIMTLFSRLFWAAGGGAWVIGAVMANVLLE